MTSVELIEACRQAFVWGDETSRCAVADHAEALGLDALAADIRAAVPPMPRGGLTLVADDRSIIIDDLQAFAAGCLRRVAGWKREGDLMFGTVKVRLSDNKKGG